MNPDDARDLAVAARAIDGARQEPGDPADHGDASAAVRAGAESDPSAAFRPLLLAAAWRVADAAVARFGEDDVAERFPFLLDYAGALADSPDNLVHAPLRALVAAAGLPPAALEIWLVCGLVEEDARFGAVFEALDLDAAERRPGVALMQTWWGTVPREGLRPALRALLDCGLLRACAPGAARAAATYEVEDNCWSAARGEPPERPAPGLRLLPAADAPALDSLVLDDATRVALGLDGADDGDGGRDDENSLRARLAAHASVIARGADHNGRTALLRALARAEGRDVLLIDWPPDGQPAAEAARLAPPWLGAFATLAGARPVLRLRATPGERLRLPPLAGHDGWIGLVCADDDSLDDLPAPVLALRLPLPDAARRTALVARHAPPAVAAQAVEVASRLHLSSGHLVTALRRLDAGMALAGDSDRAAPTADRAAAMHATQATNAEADASTLAARLRETALAAGAAELDNLARRLDTTGADRAALVLDPDTARDLDALAARCAQRDRLRDSLPSAFAARLNAGVRALFAGPSGTGKTLAAQVLAARLGLPLYRLDLSSVVSKYIGETERNLHRLLAAAEALDVMLLLDEGDALLARRTEVGNAHDRYANLETNFLLQRLETHRGLVLVTTNALERIDTAFLRRFDLIAQFRAPEFAERLALWRAHLPPDHDVPDDALDRIADACALAGGQIRNVVLDVASAALARGERVGVALLHDALRREYRRAGALFPLGR
ncbi:AAA family ATPase [Derxia gummosa]|uniref:AAA family ATPase n=1 Tax=Derxia gummosa DSM 723 TaxID=1121388 RepID=A0A8B6X8T7_9BURK|nr:ATP-binding protein [Derxia gummosa]